MPVMPSPGDELCGNHSFELVAGLYSDQRFDRMAARPVRIGAKPQIRLVWRDLPVNRGATGGIDGAEYEEKRKLIGL